MAIWNDCEDACEHPFYPQKRCEEVCNEYLNHCDVTICNLRKTSNL